MIDPRDEDLYRQYCLAWITSGKCNTTDTADALAVDAVIRHRRRFPLPAPREPWRDIIEALYGMALKPTEIVRSLDNWSAKAVYRDIERLMVAGALEERDDGSLVTAEKFRATTLDERLAKIAAALGGGA